MKRVLFRHSMKRTPPHEPRARTLTRRWRATLSRRTGEGLGVRVRFMERGQDTHQSYDALTPCGMSELPVSLAARFP